MNLDKGYLWGKKEGSGDGVGYKWIFICIYYVLLHYKGERNMKQGKRVKAE